MSVHVLSGGQETYYLREVAQGAEEYYTERGEVPGRWLGSLATSSGLVGEVDAEDLGSVLAGVLPSSGERIARCNRKNAAIDVTLSAPKSVSVLWALADPTVAHTVIDAHDHAVDVALGYLECEAAKARRGKAGCETVDGDGLLAAGFRHRTSRFGDPQLHTHVLVANATRCADGKWRSLHGRYLYHHARAAGHLYQVELRHGLTAALGVSWTPTVKGFAEIDGIDASVLAEFSQRRAQVVAEQDRTGDRSQAGARRAAKRTRPTKSNDVDYRALRADWTRRAAVLGLSVEDVRRLTRAQRVPQRDVVDVDDATIAALVTTNRSVYERRQVVIAVANLVPESWTAERVEERVDTYLAGREAVPIGVSMFGLTYSTAELVEIEHRLIARAETRVGERAECAHTVDIVDGVESLSGEQRSMVETITTSGDGVSVVVGAAGTGKTYALGVARRIWEADGYTVIGAALAARAAANLQDGSGIPSCSLDRLLGQLEQGRLRLWSDTVVVIDEAAMVGTRKLDQILDHAHRAGSKIVLVGDHHQLPEIDAGGAFAALAHRLGAVTLHDNRRQRDPAERAALAELRAGDIDDALSLLAATGNVHEHHSRDEANEAMVNAWLDDVLDEGADSMMLAAGRGDVADLNDLARARLRVEGALERRELVVGARGFSVGDWVVTTRNDYPLGILNGRRGIVTTINPNDASLTATVGDNGYPVKLSRVHLDNGYLDHGYALTIHKAQGLTCDTVHVLGDETLYREAAYTALSRGRQSNHLHLAPNEEANDSHLPEQIDEQGLDALSRALANSRQQRLATIDLLNLPEVSITTNADIERNASADLDWGIEL